MENSGIPQTKPNGTEIFELLGIACSRGCPLFRTMLFRSLEEISKKFKTEFFVERKALITNPENALVTDKKRK